MNDEKFVRACLVVALSLGLSACAPSPIRAAWYLLDPPSGACKQAKPVSIDGQTKPMVTGKSPPCADSPVLYLALLNTAPDSQRLTDLRINGNAHASGRSPGINEVKLESGELRLIDLSEGPAGGGLRQCHLPVRLTLIDKSGWTRSIPLTGSMPNYLHEDWIDGCLRSSRL